MSEKAIWKPWKGGWWERKNKQHKLTFLCVCTEKDVSKLMLSPMKFCFRASPHREHFTVWAVQEDLWGTVEWINLLLSKNLD